MAYEIDPTADHSGGGGSWLGVGTHDVIVTNNEFGFNSTGSKYVELTFSDGGGATHKERFTLLDNCIWKIAKVFNAVGHTAKVDIEAPGALKKTIHNKPLRISIVLGKANPTTGKQYRQIADILPPMAQAAGAENDI